MSKTIKSLIDRKMAYLVWKVAYHQCRESFDLYEPDIENDLFNQSIEVDFERWFNDPNGMMELVSKELQ